MGTKCPVDECKEVRDLQIAVFGNRQDGLTYKIKEKLDETVFKNCMNNYMKKPPIWLSSIIVVYLLGSFSSSIATGYKVYFGQQSAPLIYAGKDLANNNKTDIKLLKQNYEALNKSIDKLGVHIESREKKVDDQFKEQNKKIEKGFDEIKGFMKMILKRKGG